MAWRGLHLSEPARLSWADGQMVVAQEDGDVRLALEDLAWVVIDTPRATLTSALLAACMEAGLAVIFTDRAHTPSGLLLPFHQHHRQAAVARMQIAASAPLQKRLWQRIVQRKIGNQAACLECVARDGGDTLRAMARRVASGDPGNVEAQAARFYWGRLWQIFRRDDAGDRRNALLNYGYAIVRGGVARALVAAGLLPAFGLKHASVTNAFNLADDLMEPLRPFVDLAAWRLCPEPAEGSAMLSVAERRTLTGLLLAETRVGTEVTTLLNFSESMAQSFVRCLEQGRAQLLELPVLVT